MKFAKVTLQCLGCKSPLPQGEAALCHNCKSREVEVYYGKVQASVAFEREFARLWTQCQRCQATGAPSTPPFPFAARRSCCSHLPFTPSFRPRQGDMHKDVLCTSRDCPIFYKRKKVQKDLKSAQETLSRFDATAW